MDSHQENAKVFKALCDPKRLAILEQLRSGEKCACVLLEPMDLTQSGLSYHMKILCDSGLVTTLSLPSLIMLRKAVKPKLLALFIFICTAGIILVGYLFNILQTFLI